MKRFYRGKRIRNLICTIFVWLCITNISYATHYTNSTVSEDVKTGTLTLMQESFTNNTYDTEEKLLLITQILRKSFVEVDFYIQNEAGCNVSAWFQRNPLTDPMNSNLQAIDFILKESGTGSLSKRWVGDVDPSMYRYYIKTYAHKGLFGHSYSKVTVKIFPYFNLTYERSGGKGTAQFYKNGETLDSKTLGAMKVYKASDAAKMVIAPSPGYSFVRLEMVEPKIDPAPLSSTKNADGSQTTSTFTMNKDKKVVAYFSLNSLTLPDNPIMTVGSDLIFDWLDPVNPADIEKYEVQIKVDGQENIVYQEYVSGATQLKLPGTLSPSKKYRAYVRSIDKEKNSSQWISSPVFSQIPQPVTLSATPRSENRSGAAYYQVALKLGGTINADSFVIERAVPGGNWSVIKTLTAADLLSGNNEYIDTSGLVKHGQYQYRIYTKNILGVTSTTNYISPSTVTIPNIPLQYSYEFPASGTIAKSRTISFDINPKIDTLESETLAFRIVYNRPGQTPIASSTSLQSNKVTITFPDDGSWEWKAEVCEYPGSTTFTYPGTFKIDTTNPTGSFKVVDSVNTGKEFTPTTPTITTDLTLAFTNIGDACAGVEGVYLWNGGGTRPTRMYQKSEVLNSTNQWIQTTAKAEIANGTACLRMTSPCSASIPWVIPGGDGSKTVQMQVVDNVQHSIQLHKSFLLDTVAPTGTFQIVDILTPTQEYTILNPSTKTEATLMFSSIGDNTSGVEGVYIWNGTGVLPQKLYNASELIANHQWIDQAKKEEIASGTAAMQIKGTIPSSTLWILGTVDGTKTVNMQVKDHAAFTTKTMKKVLVDTMAPTASFKVVDPINTASEYTSQAPTSKVDLAITMSNIADAGSGVEGIYLWNGTGTLPAKVYTKAEVLNVSNQWVDAAKKTEIALGLASVYISDNTTSLSPWIIATGDGTKRVNLRVKDKAGLIFDTWRELLLDTKVPETPTGFTHIHLSDVKKVRFTFTVNDMDKDITHYVVKYIIDSIETTVSNLTIQGTTTKTVTFDIDVAGINPNTRIEVRAKSIDRANLASAEGTYVAYTQAALGTLTLDGSSGYDPIAKTFILQWSLHNAGEASRHVLEYGRIENTSFIRKGTLANTSGHFTHTGLLPHDSYHYRLVAYNNSNDPTVGTPKAQIVPNTKPTLPVLKSPINGNWARKEVTFNFDRSIDADGDTVTEKLYLGADTATPQFVAIVGPGGQLTKSDLEHNMTYTWYVTATDGTATVQSVSETFTVDAEPPTMTMTPVNRPFSKQTQLTVTVGDAHSGVNEITYTRTAKDGTILDSNKPVQLTSVSGSSYSGSIPLPEGEYHLSIKVTDKVGNERTNVGVTDLNNLIVDRTAPTLTNVSFVGLRSFNGTYASGKAQIPIQFTANDAGVGVDKLRYWFVDSQTIVPEGDGQVALMSAGQDQYNLMVNYNAMNGKTVYLVTRVEDKLGHASSLVYSGPIVIDITPPQIFFSVESLGGGYVTDLSQLIVSANATDSESTNVSVNYNIISDQTGTWVTNWANWDIVKNTQLTAGQRYRIQAKATNQTGLETLTESALFTYDHTAPILQHHTVPQVPLALGEVAVFTVDAVDLDTPIVEYGLAIGSTAGGTNMTSQIQGQQNGWLTYSAATKEIRVIIPQTAQEGTYYPTLTIKNAAGLIQTVSLNTIVIHHIQERLIVTDQGDYTTSTGTLSASWKYIGQKMISSYQYRVVDSGGIVVQDWKSTLESASTVSDLSLIPGKMYRFEVQATYSAPDVGVLKGSSPGTVVDTTPPLIAEVQTPVYATSDNIYFTWSGDDPESCIDYVMGALGNDYGSTNLTDGWVKLTGNKLYRNAQGNPIPLTDGQRVYLTLRFYNKAGMVTEKILPVIRIDNTPPQAPMVRDQGEFINPAQSLTFNWFETISDPESGNEEYLWALLEYGQDPASVSWYSAGTKNKIDLKEDAVFASFTPVHGKTYYLAVKAKNGSGLISATAYSDGIIVDATAPLIPTVVVTKAVNVGQDNAEEVNYITDTSQLGVWIHSDDPESQLRKEFYYSYGKRDQVDTLARIRVDDEWFTINNPTIPEGEVIVFAAESVNNAGLKSPTGYSTGLILDTTYPKITEVHGEFVGNQLFFDWNVIANSPIVKYEVQLVKGSEVNSHPDETKWVNNGTISSYTCNVADQPEGDYCLLVRATNSANVTSRRDAMHNEWGVSQAITVDLTKPMVNSVTSVPYAVDTIQIAVSAQDNRSGLSVYQYALGTLNDPTAYSSRWIDVPATSENQQIDIPTTGIPTNTNLYVTVKVKDDAGLWSDPKASSQIRIDRTKPDKPAVTRDLATDVAKYTTFSNMIKNVTFTSRDQESGVTHYQMGLVRAIDGDWLENPAVQAMEQLDSTITTVQTLQEDENYYIKVQVQNGAGLWSEPGYLGPITVDTTKPTITFADHVFNYPPETGKHNEIPFTLSEASTVTFKILNTKTDIDRTVTRDLQDLTPIDFTESEAGIYTLSAIPTDRAGNTGSEVMKTIRINQLPTITFEKTFTGKPGEEIQMSATVVDVDGTIVEYRWSGEDVESRTDITPKFIFTNPGDYQITLTVKDNDNGITSKQTTISIRNTEQGTLLVDETWSNTHRVYGDIIVPAGVVLTISSGTEVIMDGANANHLITVQGTLNIPAGTARTRIHSSLGTVASWRGIVVEGQANLNQFDLEDASCGISVSGEGNVILTNVDFHKIQDALMIIGGRVTLNGSTITDATCGIKTSGTPVVNAANITLKGTIDALNFAGGQVDINTITIEDASCGIQISGSTVAKIANSTLLRNSNVLMVSGGQVTMTDMTVSEGAQGITILDTGTATISTATFTGNSKPLVASGGALELNTLTIREASEGINISGTAQVTIRGANVSTTGNALTIEGGTASMSNLIIGEAEQGLIVSANADVTISQADLRARNIVLNLRSGQTRLTDVIVSDAERGMVIADGTTVAILRSHFNQNTVGMQILGGQVHIQDSIFSNNTLYGIKEDEQGRPTVANCIFNQNGMHYYHTLYTMISVEKLNQFEGNSGNQYDVIIPVN